MKAPHFVLFSESTGVPASPGATDGAQAHGESAGFWHFVLRTEEGTVALDAHDEEADASRDRLALLAVVRGLEALPEPSRVTLVTTSSWVRRGLRFGLDNWRDQQWQWERFGRMTPIKNADLWQRVDRALQFHEVDCRTIRIDRPSDDLSRPAPLSLLERHGKPAKAADAAAWRGPSPHITSGHHGRIGRFLLHAARRLCHWCRLGRSDEALMIAAS